MKSVVVLPFENLTGDPKNEYLADGITEQLTDALAQIPTLRVVARTSAFQFKGKGADIREIGRRLKADAVVEGSLRSINGSYRLTVQVNRSRDGYHIFSRTFDGGMQELGRMENDMAPLVLASLRPRIAIPKRKAPDPQAYDLLLKARATRMEAPQDAFKHAVAFLNQAIERDPGYAEAYGALAGVYAAAADNFATEALPYAEKARAAAATALQLDPESADAYAAQGFIDGIIFMDWRKGERELRRAIRLSPQSAKFHSWLAANLLCRTRFVESIAEFRRIDDLDPLAPNVGLGVGYYGQRNYDAALQQFTRIRDLHPDLIIIHSFLGAIWEAKGQYDKAMAEYRMLPPAYATMTNPQIAHLLASMGRIAEARKMLSTLEDSVSGVPAANPFMIACIHARLGDRDLAFQWLNRAYQQHMVWFLKIHPSLDSIRGDPRYWKLLKKSGLAD